MIDKKDISRKANSTRNYFGEDANSPIDVFALAFNIENLSVVFSKLRDSISGMLYRGEHSSIIAINSEMSLGRQRFTMAHELYHYYYDENMGTVVCPKNSNDSTENEKRADYFASCLLMPETGLYNRIEKIHEDHKSLTIEDVIKLEQFFKVSHAAMLVRLKEEKFISGKEYDKLKDNVKAKATMMNYDTSLYERTDSEKTVGYHIALANKLYDAGKIGESKWKEILRDSFREDIVEGDCKLEEDTFE